MKRIATTLTLCAFAVGAAWAQGSSGTAGTSTGTGTGVGATSTAPAAQPGTGTRNIPNKDAKIARADRKFIEDAAASGMFEVQVSQLAATKATDKAVKDYAAMLADHHSAANNELIQLANGLGLELPPAPPRSKRRDIENMAKKTGAEFDQEFVREVGIEAHEKDIKRFRDAAKDVKDPQLKAWIDKTLPRLQQHLSAAQNLPQAGSKAAEAVKSSGQSGQSGPGGTGGMSGANKTGS